MSTAETTVVCTHPNHTMSKGSAPARMFLIKSLLGSSFFLFLFTCCSAADLPWIKETIATEGDVGSNCSVRIDSKGNSCISYLDGYPNYRLRYSEWLGAQWNTESIDTAAGATALALDTVDIPHIAYPGQGGYLKYAVRMNGLWTVRPVGVGARTVSLALDQSRYPHIAFASGDQLKYATGNGNSWTVSTIDAVGSYGGCTSIAVDRNNNVHIAYIYQQEPGGVVLKYAHWDGVAWSTASVDGNKTGWSCSIAVDSHDVPCIAYSGREGIPLKFARLSGGTWTTQTVDATYGGEGVVGLAIDADDVMHVSYHCNSTLKYARYERGVWTKQTLDSSGYMVGDNNSIAVDSNRYVCVAYSFDDFKDLKLTRTRKKPDLMFVDEIMHGHLPYSGNPLSTIFTFKVRYIDEDNDPVRSGYPLLHIFSNGLEIAESPVPMRDNSPHGQNLSPGKIYSCAIKLPENPNYSYSVEAYDAYGFPARGLPCNVTEGPIVSGMALRDPGDVKITSPGNKSGIINPDKGDRVQIWFQGNTVGTYTCHVLNTDGELLFENTRTSVNDGFFEWAPKGIASGIYIAHVEGPGFNVKKKIAVLR